MELSPLPVEVFQACIVRAVRNSEALILRLAQRTEVLLQQAVSGSDSAPDMLHFRAWQAWTTHRSRLLTRYPQALLSVVGRYNPATGDEAAVLAELSRQAPAAVEVIQKTCELIATQDEVEKAQERLKSRFAQLLGLDAAQALPNPLHSSIYVLAFVRSLNNPALEVDVLARWLESMQGHLSKLLASEYDYLARFVYDRGLLGPLSTGAEAVERAQTDSEDVQERSMAQRREESWRAPQRYGDAMAQSRAYARQISGYDAMLTQLIGQLSRDQRWIDGSQKVPDLSPDLLASLRINALEEETQGGGHDAPAEPLTMSAKPDEVDVICDGVAGTALEPEVPQQAAEIVQQVLAEITNGTSLLPEVRNLLRQLEPVLQQLALNDHSFVHHSEHPARHWVEELVGRSQRFLGEQSEEFTQFIQVAEVAVMQLQTSLMPDAATFEIVLEAMVKEWSRPGMGAEHQSSGRPQVLPKPEPTAGQAASPNVQFIAKAVRQLTNTAQAPVDIIEFLNETWVQVVVHAYGQQAEVAGTEVEDESRKYQQDDAGSYLSMIPGLLWSVGPKAIQDTQRLSLLAPRLQEKLVQGLSRIGKTSEYVQQITARLAGIYQDTLDASLDRIRQTSAGLDLDLYLDLGVPMMEPTAQVDILLDLDEFIGDDEPQQQPVSEHDAEPQKFSTDANYDVSAATELAEELEDFDVTQAVADEPARQAPEQAPDTKNEPETDLNATEERQAVAGHDELFADARLLHAVRADVQQAMAVAGEEKPTEAGVLASSDQALAAASIDWPIGTWLQLQNEEQKILTQLTWVNPEGKLFLFTSPDGSTQSMTRRTLDRLVAQGRLKRVIFANPAH